jgi:hypothetical protein
VLDWLQLVQQLVSNRDGPVYAGPVLGCVDMLNKNNRSGLRLPPLGSKKPDRTGLSNTNHCQLCYQTHRYLLPPYWILKDDTQWKQKVSFLDIYSAPRKRFPSLRNQRDLTLTTPVLVPHSYVLSAMGCIGILFQLAYWKGARFGNLHWT